MADDKAKAEGEKYHSEVAKAEREILKLKQKINRHQAIPKSSTGETHNLGNAPTPEPVEPTVNEPGNVVFKTHSEPDAEGKGNIVVHTPPEAEHAGSVPPKPAEVPRARPA
jgi:hypothetical protein